MANAKYSEKAIRESLEAQLVDHGANVLHFRELIDSYLYFYGMEKKMRADVKKRGLTVVRMSASGNEAEVENPSIRSAAMYNRQRLAILKEMGLTTANVRILSEDGDDL